MSDIIHKIKSDPFANFLGITFDRIDPGFASCSLTIKDHLFNFLGVVHGGLIFSLADVAFSAASNCDHLPSFALDVSGSFLKTAKLGDVIYAEAELIHTTKRTGVYRMQVYNNKVLIALFTGTVFRSSSGKTATATIENNPIWTESLSGMEFIFIPGGRFMMGDLSGQGLENEEPVHEVSVDGFYLAKTPVTQGQWKSVTGVQGGSPSLGPDYPVTHVNYAEIEGFFALLNDRHKGHTFAFPTEAEWEYAARSGGKNDLFSGSDTAETVAWFGENSGGHPQPVAQKKPNDLGLYDMSGNVWEWCRDGYQEDAYKNHSPSNPVVSGEHGSDRVARGGSWLMDAWSVRCTRRFSFPEDVSGNGLGFRAAMYRG